MDDSVDGTMYYLGLDNEYYDYLAFNGIGTRDNYENEIKEKLKEQHPLLQQQIQSFYFSPPSPPLTPYNNLPLYFHGDNDNYYLYTQNSLLNYLNGNDKFLYKYINGSYKLLFFLSTSDHIRHRYSYKSIRDHPTTDYDIYFTDDNINMVKCGKVAQFDQLNPIPPPIPPPRSPPPPALPLSQIYSNQLDVCVIKNACYLLLMKILNEKPLLSSKITSLINDLKDDFDKNCLILSELTNTYNLCKSEIKINQSVWIIDDDENGIIKEKLNEEEYLIKCNNGEEKKKKKSEIIANSLN